MRHSRRDVGRLKSHAWTRDDEPGTLARVLCCATSFSGHPPWGAPGLEAANCSNVCELAHPTKGVDRSVTLPQASDGLHYPEPGAVWSQEVTGAGRVCGLSRLC